MRQWEMRFQLLHFRSLFSKRMFYQLEKKYMRFFAMKLATIVLGAENIRIALTQLISMNIIGDFFFSRDKILPMVKWKCSAFCCHISWARPLITFSVRCAHWSELKNALWKILKLIYIYFPLTVLSVNISYNGYSASEVYYCHDILLFNRAHSAHILWPFIATTKQTKNQNEQQYSNTNQKKSFIIIFWHALRVHNSNKCQKQLLCTMSYANGVCDMDWVKNCRERHVTRWFWRTVIREWNGEKKCAKKKIVVHSL